MTLNTLSEQTRKVRHHETAFLGGDASKESLVKVAIVGAGGMGRAWKNALETVPDTNVRMFVDPLIGTDHEAPWLADYPATLQAQDLSSLTDEIDAVVVTALSPAHTEIVRTALERGYHVIVEKPFVTSLEDAQALVALADQRHKTLMVSQNYRFFPGPQRVREIAQNGDYGPICAVAGQFWCDWPGKPYQHEMLHPMALEMAIHHFDLARAMFGAEAVSGHVEEWNPAWSPYRMGGALEALFRMATAESTFPFLYTGGLVGRAPRTPWGGLWRFEFERATLVADVIDESYGLYLATEAGYERLCDFGDDSMSLAKSFQHFKTCVETNTEPWSSGRDNLGTLALALAYTSEDEGEVKT